MKPSSSTTPHTIPLSYSKEQSLVSGASQNLTEYSTAPDQPDAGSVASSECENIRYTKAMAALPDIREERIARIQKALEKGQYSVSSQELADKLIQDITT